MVADLIVLKVLTGGKDTGLIKVVWTYGGTGEAYSYYISKDLIENAGREVRLRLGFLVEAVRIKSGTTEVGAALTALADAGGDLYDCLFAGDGVDDTTSQERRRWFEGLAVECNTDRHPEIRVIVSSEIYVPWGLIFFPRLADDLRGSTEFAAYQNFWSHRHFLSTIHEMVSCSTLDPVFPVDSTVFIAALSRDVRARLEAVDRESLKEWKWMNGIDSSHAFFKELKKSVESKASQIIYFYCHANGEKLALQQNSDHIDVETFSRKTSGRDRQRPALFLLNGCSTAAGDARRGWIRVTSQYGAQGFVGTEVKVPDLFAWRYGIDFLSRFLGGYGTISEVLRELREKHWPLSLLYGAYCFPNWKIAGSFPAPRVEVVSYSNLSESALGSGVME